MKSHDSGADERARVFEEHRRGLEGLADRMLGTLAVAQDVVQETYLRWSAAAGAGPIAHPRAWLLTTCGRLAMDVLKSARRNREVYPGTWLPEPLLDRERPEPSDLAELDETVMLALERLSPAERAAYLLHDVFDQPFDEVAACLGRSVEAARKLASRARERVLSGRPRFRTTSKEHERLLGAFVCAARAGEIEQLRSFLVEQVELHADGGGRASAAAEVVRGDHRVAELLVRVWRAGAPGAGDELVPCRFNGGPGLLVREGGRTVTALSLEIEGGRIARIFALRNPDKLRAFDEG